MQRFSNKYKFSSWPNREIPNIAAGVYVIWEGEDLIYSGMSGREYEKAVSASKVKYGLITRLSSHASGRLSGDQFCVYVANRLLIPKLQSNQLTKFESGELTLDRLTKEYIHARLEYQYAIVESSAQAYSLEAQCRSGLIFGRLPKLNPLQAPIPKE